MPLQSASAATVVFAAQAVMTGGTASTTLNVVWQVVVLFAASVAVRVTTTEEATLTTVPAGGFCEVVTALRQSPTRNSGRRSGTTVAQPLVMATTRFDGQFTIVGAVVS